MLRSAEAAERAAGCDRRRDPRAVLLMRELPADPEGAAVLTFRAAEILGAPELVPARRTRSTSTTDEVC
ncbi:MULTISPECIES: hypothetical protein [unclassified Kitasatospora]|uniref:hypothetical protein n=1 Tax=unclassified Kitasatospora TaxID=2633591 RepID=UPI001AE0AA70|nr:hypothetical protein [Kitasatospora sp. RG8]